jgi:hypothetical protein
VEEPDPLPHPHIQAIKKRKNPAKVAPVRMAKASVCSRSKRSDASLPL